jgi:para-aminobenzoate synthetase component 1
MTNNWYWRSLVLENRTGSEIFATLFGSHPIATLLESPFPTPEDRPQLARYSICAGAPRTINGRLQMWTPRVGEILPFLRQLLHKQGDWGLGTGNWERNTQSPIPNRQSPIPFTGGWLGWLGYDLAWEIERLPRDKPDSLPFPVAFWYEPDCFAVLDHWDQALWLATSQPQQLDELERKLKEDALTRGQEDAVKNSQSPCKVPQSPIHFCTTQEDYEAAVRRAKKYIQAGDIFQANLSLRFQTQTAASGWSIYQALQSINPSPFASYWRTPWGEVVSCSPERLVDSQRCADGKFRVSTRPIAGTRSRGTTPEQDKSLAQELLSNAKERAEHIMLVDLERNDLGRVCEWGSVAVDELLTIERYSHVMHLVSNVTGMLKHDLNSVDLIRAMFPGGTITGCPKVRCMEIIEELEPLRRSLFYGSCGYLDWRGNLDLNIFIRTLLVAPSAAEDAKIWGDGDSLTRGPSDAGRKNQLGTQDSGGGSRGKVMPCPYDSGLYTVWGQVGAGIVADSDPEREWFESLHKAQAQLAAIQLVKGE